MSSKYKILIIDDEADIREVLSYNLEKEGYEVSMASGGVEGIKKAEKFQPHLILLDIMMPGMDGLEVCRKLREQEAFDDTIIVFLTARNESFTQIEALDSGGDEFITKPVRMDVLKSHIKAIIRRIKPEIQSNSTQKYVYGNMEIDNEQFSVTISGEDAGLVKKEFEILQLLTASPGKVFTRDEILVGVWGREVIVGDRTIDVHIRKLREKIGRHYIHTMKGVGYKFDYKND